MVEKKFLKAVKEFKLIKKGESILVAFSGGIDSTVLTYLLLKLKSYLGIKEIILAHLNHLLRGKDSDLDEAFSIEFAKKYNLRIYTKKVNIKELSKKRKKSIEEVAREERYRFFNEVIEKENLDKLATGHHLSDLSETMLLWFIQGNKKGIKGFKPKEKFIIRPLFLITKDEIEKYAEENSIQYRVDITNFQTEFLRNKIRHNIIPEIKKINPSFENSLLTMSFFINWDDEFLENEANRISLKFPERKIELETLRNLPEALLYRILRNWVYKHTDIYPSYRQLYEIVKIIKETEGYREYNIGGKYLLTKNHKKVCIKRYNKDKTEFLYRIKIGDTVFIKEANLKIKAFRYNEISSKKLIFNDKTFVCFDLPDNPMFEIRNRKEGDRFLPFGKRTEKKLKDVMIDLKISKDMRDTIPLLVYRNKILWIVGYKRSGYFPVKEDSKNIVCFKLEEV